MKRLLSMILIVCLAAAPVFALAEGAEELPALNWEDVAEAAAQIPGGFVSSEDMGVMFWLPDILQPVEVPADENSPFQLLGLYVSEETPLSVAVTFGAMDGGIEQYWDTLAKYGGASDFEQMTINGMYTFSYDVKENDACVVCFPTEEGNVLSFMLSPMSDENCVVLSGMIMASFQPVE